MAERESLRDVAVPDRPASGTAPGPRESHVPRDESERPLIGLCGVVCGDPTRAPRDGAPGEKATCVVCQDMWDAGCRPKGWGWGS